MIDQTCSKIKVKSWYNLMMTDLESPGFIKFETTPVHRQRIWWDYYSDLNSCLFISFAVLKRLSSYYFGNPGGQFVGPRFSWSVCYFLSPSRYPNVLILTTSNVTEAIDLAFVDRADIKQYIGPPSAAACFKIYHSCLNELMRVRRTGRGRAGRGRAG